jgi:3-hydroxymyristoyl/3-hydroxydecanoyl-(acyl carrier protein) dehydratase
MASAKADPGASQQAEALSYMKKVEKRVKPIENSLNPYASLNALDKLKFQQEVRPELNITLKLEVAKAPIKDRAFIQDVAEVFEEIL